MTSSHGDDVAICGRRVAAAWRVAVDWVSSCKARVSDAVDRARDDGGVFADDGRCSAAAARLLAVWRPAHAGCRRLVGQAVGWCKPGAGNLREKLNFCRAVFAEFVGTFFLVLIGCGSATEQAPYSHEQQLQQDRALRVALAFGLTYTCSLYCLRRGTDGHLNPAVTVALTVLRRVSLASCICFVIAQFCGALCGSAVLRSVTPLDAGGLLGCTVTADGLGQLRGLSIELFGSLLFVFVVCAGLIGSGDDCCASVESTIASETYSARPVATPFVAGATLSALSLLAVTYTGASFNTARSFGPAIFANVWTAHWIYWFGPFLGGVAGAKLYDVIFINSPTALQPLKEKLLRLARRFTRRAPPAESRSEAGSVDPWETTHDEERCVWRRNSVYSARSVLVDRAVQSSPTAELMTTETTTAAKTVAEDCLALTTTAIRGSEDTDEISPSAGSPETEMDITLAGSTSGASLHRSTSYQQAIDNSTQPADADEHSMDITSPDKLFWVG